MTNWYLLVKSEQWKYQSNVWNLLKTNNEETRTTSFLYPVKTSENLWCSHVFNRYRNDFNLVSLLLILSRFYPLFWCFYCIFNWINFDYVLTLFLWLLDTFIYYYYYYFFCLKKIKSYVDTYFFYTIYTIESL